MVLSPGTTPNAGTTPIWPECVEDGAALAARGPGDEIAGSCVVLENDTEVVLEVDEDSNVVVVALKPLIYLKRLV